MTVESSVIADDMKTLGTIGQRLVDCELFLLAETR